MVGKIKKGLALSLIAAAAGAFLGGCGGAGGGAGGAGAATSTTGSVKVAILNGPFTANTGNSIQITANAATDQTVIQSMSWTSQASDPAAPALVSGNDGCGTATKNTVVYPSNGQRASGYSNWTCALAVSAPASLLATTTYTINVTVKDDKGTTNFATTTVTYVATPAAGGAPGAGGAGGATASAGLVASAGKGLNVNPGQTVALDASATGWFDSLGKAMAGPTVSYQWATSYPGVVINNANAAVTTFVAPPSIATATQIPFTLTATAGGVTSVANVVFLVDPFAPFTLTVNPSAQVVDTAGPGVATLIASGSTTNGSPTLYYNWTFVSGPVSPTLGGQQTSTLGFVPTVPGIYVFQVAVGYQPITASYPGVYFANGTVTAK